MKKGLWFVLSMFIVLLDQWTKALAVNHLVLYVAYPVLPMFNLTLAHNTGAAFSFLSSAGAWHTWFFVVFSALVSGVLVFWIIRQPDAAKTQNVALSFILGGALGNLIDRLHYGYVIDFIDVYYKQYHWPIFNVADCAITLGALLLIGDMLHSKKA